jgi:hypothetical protein
MQPRASRSTRPLARYTIPGENTVALYVGWAHGIGEPIGTYVFKFTIHGKVNGTAVVLTASSPPIQMSASRSRRGGPARAPPFPRLVTSLPGHSIK